MFERTYHPTHPAMMDGASNADLAEQHRIDNLFRDGELTLVYSHGERFVIGAAVPGAGSLRLPDQTEPASAAGLPLLDRRELGVVQVGGRGTVTVDGVATMLDPYEALYVPMGSREVTFAGEGARFFLLSVPAHRAYPLQKVSAADAPPMRRGDAATGNARTIHQLILPHRCASAALCLGITILDPGSVWNTMPPHVHDRRSEVYLYFGLGSGDRVMHYMGRPDAMRHIVVGNEQVVLSPPWSVHMGVGTRAYGFVWAMAGENLDYEDMDVADVAALR